MAVPQVPDSSMLDEILLDLAVLIELSPYDRRIVENRYRILKEYIERPSSPLRPYIVDGESLIYAQGSIATSTTVLSGDESDRFDLDAIVEIDVPPGWSDDEALNRLFDTLQNFPGVRDVVRCTRCVQLQFAFMHIDVTIMDRRARIPGLRPGQIFHSPDSGPSFRVDSNPWGFTDWFRAQIGTRQTDFERRLQKVRDASATSRLVALDENERRIVADAEQVPLPNIIPTRLDSQQVIALKLLKRCLNLKYQNSSARRPPSIWITKLTADLGLNPHGLSHQLHMLADGIAYHLRDHLESGTVPQEENPSYPPDRINDRWPRPLPEGRGDMSTLADHLDELTTALEQMVNSTQADILAKIDELFGEKFGAEERRVLRDRYDRRVRDDGLLIRPGAGTLYSPALVKGGSDVDRIPPHRFHPMRLPSSRPND